MGEERNGGRTGNGIGFYEHMGIQSTTVKFDHLFIGLIAICITSFRVNICSNPLCSLFSLHAGDHTYGQLMLMHILYH